MIPVVLLGRREAHEQLKNLLRHPLYVRAPLLHARSVKEPTLATRHYGKEFVGPSVIVMIGKWRCAESALMW